MSQQPDDAAGSAGAAEADELQGYGNDTGFAAEADPSDANAPSADADDADDDATDDADEEPTGSDA